MANNGSAPLGSPESPSVACRRSGPRSAMVLPPEGLCQLTSAKANPACSGDVGRGFGCDPLNGFFTKSFRSLKSYWLPKNIRIGSRLLWQPKHSPEFVVCDDASPTSLSGMRLLSEVNDWPSDAISVWFIVTRC